MKFLIALCFVGAVICTVQADSTPEIIEEYKTMRKECVDKAGVSMDMVTDARKNSIFADDEKMGSYMRCMFEKSGMMSHDGTMHTDVMLQRALHTMTETEAKPTIDKCMDKTKDMTNLEKKAYEFFKCFRTTHGKSLD